MNWLETRAFAILCCASFVLQLVHLLQFLVVFGTGIVFQLLFYLTQHEFYGTKSPFGLECFVTLITVALGAAFTVDSSNINYKAVNIIAIKHPIIFFTIPNSCCAMIFLLSYACITKLFFTLPDVDHYVLNKDWLTGGAYLLCASYIVYVVVSMCCKDRIFIRDRISNCHQCCQFVAFIVAGLLQAATIFGIIKPVMEILKDYLIFYQFQPAYIVGYMLLVSLIMGITGGILEKYAHCVVHKRKAPFYWYENSVESRTCVLQLVALPIHYGFCKPGKSLPVEIYSPNFMLFTIYSSLALMQLTKIVYLIVFDHKNLDVVCGYSNRTSKRESRRIRSLSRNPRMHLARTTADQEENNQYYEGPMEELDPNNNQLRQNNRSVKQNEFPDGKNEKSVGTSDGFLSFLLPMELPIIFVTHVLLTAAVKFVQYSRKYKVAHPVENCHFSNNFPLENLRSISNEDLPAQQNGNKSKISVVSIESEHISLGTDTTRDEVLGATANIPKVFSDIHDHVSGDNVHAMVNMISSAKN